jgi:type IV secretion system protein VirD4
MRRSTQVMPNEHNPVLWFLDEIAHIGHMQAIEDAATLMRSQGVRLWLFVQSLGQLKTCFGDKAQIVLDNCGTQQFFGINAYATSDELSKRIGDATIGIRSVNDTTSYSLPTGNARQEGGSRSNSTAVTSSEMARRVWKPEEILTLPSDVALIFHKNLPVIPVRLVRWFEAREFFAGGTATPRRLGLAAVLQAAFTLCASGVAAVATLAVARAATLPRITRRPATRAAAIAPPLPRRLRPAANAAPPAQRNRQVPRKRRRGPSGFLIKIQ